MTRLWVGAVASLCSAAIAACAGTEPPPAGKPDAGPMGQDASGPTDALYPDARGPSADASADASSIVDQCNPLSQNCATLDAGMSTKCSVQSGPAMCIPPSANEVGFGEQCVGFECASGLACVMTSSTSSCVKICDIDRDTGCEALGNDWDCRARITNTNWGLCTKLGPICDPITQSPCPTDQACAPLLRATGQYEFRCKPAGMQGDGQACGSAGGLECIRGYVCVQAMNSAAICRAYCARDSQCPMNESCVGNVVDPPFHFCRP